MDPELQKQLVQMLKDLSSGVSAATNWTAGQLGPLVQEKILFGRISETALLLIFVASTVALAWLGCVFAWGRIMAIKKAKGNISFGDCHADGWGFLLVAANVSAIVTFVMSVCQLVETLEVWFAPRLYIVEWLKTFVK